VQGDTNTVLAGVLTASKLQIKVIHIESGLRSYDRTMPEEINRIVADHIADILQCPTERQKEILLGEGIDTQKIIVTGNTVADAVEENIKIAEEKSDITERLELADKEYFLLTMHRPSNVDQRETMLSIIAAFDSLFTKTSFKTVFPIHPRTRKMAHEYAVSFGTPIHCIDPVGYLDMLQLIAHAQLVFTDSGGIQEEACILKTPVLTLRDTTERPETLTTGGCLLTGSNTENILKSYETIIRTKKNWHNPFGKNVTKRIFSFLTGSMS